MEKEYTALLQEKTMLEKAIHNSFGNIVKLPMEHRLKEINKQLIELKK